MQRPVIHIWTAYSDQNLDSHAQTYQGTQYGLVNACF